MSDKPKLAKDPHDVPETLCDGPFHFNPSGHLAYATFFQQRLETGALRAGSVDWTEVVVARLAMTHENWIAFRDMLNSVYPVDAEALNPTGPAAGRLKH